MERQYIERFLDEKNIIDIIYMYKGDFINKKNYDKVLKQMKNNFIDMDYENYPTKNNFAPKYNIIRYKNKTVVYHFYKMYGNRPLIKTLDHSDKYWIISDKIKIYTKKKKMKNKERKIYIVGNEDIIKCKYGLHLSAISYMALNIFTGITYKYQEYYTEKKSSMDKIKYFINNIWKD